MDELKEQWGLERYLEAMGIFVRWILDKSHPISRSDMLALREESKDAFDLFAKWMLEQAKESE